MKKKTNLIKSLLFTALILLNYSCEKENFEDELNSPNETTVKEVKFDELFTKDKKFKNLLEKISRNSYSQRSAFEDQNGFTISDGNVKIITTDSVTSYTMLIERDNNFETNNFENLVIQENNFGNQQQAFLIKYIPTAITPSIDNSFTFSGTIQKNHVAFTGFNKDTENNSTESACYMDVRMCNWGGVEHAAGWNCTIRYTYTKRIQTLCPADNPGGDGGGGGSGGGGDGEDTDQEIITSPVNTGFDGEVLGKTPCSELTKLTNSITNKVTIQDLQTKTVESKEYGYSLSKNNDNTYSAPVACNSNANNPDEIVMPTGGANVGAFHTHPLVLMTNTTNVVPMFSDGDLNWLFWVANQHTNNNQPKEYSEYFLTLTVPQGTFAIKIKNWAKFAGFRNNNNLWTNLNSNGTSGELVNLRKAYNKIGASGDFNAQTNALLKVLYESDAGIGLYEASSDLSSWNELTLTISNYTNPTTAPLKKPCL